MVTSGQTKSVMRKFTFQNASHMLTFSQASPQSQSLRKRKNIAYVYIHQKKLLEELVPSLIPLLKEHIRLGHADTVDHSIQFIDTRLKGKKDRNFFLFFLTTLYKLCIMAKTSTIWQQAANTTCNYHLLAAQKEPNKKSQLLEKDFRVFWKSRKVRRMDH